MPIRSPWSRAAAAMAQHATAAASEAHALHAHEHTDTAHEHANPHGHPAHAPEAPHHLPAQGPTPRRRPPRPPRSTKKGKARRKGSAASPDEDDRDIPETDAEGEGAGVAAARFDGEQRDGGDDDDEGGDERRRQDNLARAHLHAEGAQEGPRRLPPLHGANRERSVARFVRAACALADANAPDFAHRLRELHLDLLAETEQSGAVRHDRHGAPTLYRLDSGGRARVRERLTAGLSARPSQAPRPAPDERAGRTHCLLVAVLLQLQAPLTPTMRQERIASLKALAAR